jgi:hypothetical protein
MAYTYTTFGNITLPLYNRESDLSPVAAATRLTQTAAGVFDGDGGGRSARRYPHPLTIDAIVSESTAAAQRTAIDALRAAVGTRAALTRKADSNNDQHVAMCRLVGMTQQRSYSERGYQPVRLQFIQLTPWRATMPQTYTIPVFSGSPSVTQQVITNAGNLPVTAVRMELEIPDGVLVQTPRWTATGHDLLLNDIFTPLGLPAVIVVDGGMMQVISAGSPIYSKLVFNANHTIDSWFRLPPGDTTMTLTSPLIETIGSYVLWLIKFYPEYA